MVGARQEALRVEFGWAPSGWTPQFFTGKLGVKSVPIGSELRDRTGRDLRL